MRNLPEGTPEKPINDPRLYLNATSIRAAMRSTEIPEERQEELFSMLIGSYADHPRFRGNYEVDMLLRGLESVDATNDERQSLQMAILQKAVHLKQQRQKKRD